MKKVTFCNCSCLLILFGVLVSVSTAQDTKRPRPDGWDKLVYGGRFMDRFLPSPVRNKLTSDTWGVDAVKPRDVLNGIEEPEWSYWGGNIKKVSDKEYQLFVCRWAENEPKGHMAWRQSETVRAVAPNPWGPFKTVEVIGPGHNPEIYQTKDGSYALYVINHFYHAPTITGPWTDKEYEFQPRGRRIIQGLSNLSFAPRKDGSVVMVCRGGGIWVSETGLGPWQQITNRRVYPDVEGAFEDPVIWKTEVQYHMIVNDWRGRIAWYLRSKDGYEWTVDAGEAYLPGIDVYEDGTSMEWYKYERMRIMQDEYGRVGQANFAVIDYVKREDKPNDIHSSKNINIPLTVGRRIVVLNKNPLGPKTKTIQLKVLAEPGFNPQKDMDTDSLRFGAPQVINFGGGGKVVESKVDGADLILTFEGNGNGFTEDNFSGKLLGKTSSGKLLYGYSRLPDVTYGDAILSAAAPKIKLKNGTLDFRMDVKNFGLSASKADRLNIRLYSENSEQNFTIELPKLVPYQQKTLVKSIASTLDPSLKYHAKISSTNQRTPLFETEQNKKAPLLRIEVMPAP